MQNERGSCLRADAHPIYTFGRLKSSVGFDGDFECVVMKFVDEYFVELQEGLATGTHNESVAAGSVSGPARCHTFREFLGGRKPPARTAEADEVGVAEL